MKDAEVKNLSDRALDTLMGKLQAERSSRAEKNLQASNQKHVGKHYRYRNSYSCPESESDYWWMYIRVLGTKGGRLRVLTFQIDKYGKAHIANEETYASMLQDPITPEEYDQAAHDFYAYVLNLATTHLEP